MTKITIRRGKKTNNLSLLKQRTPVVPEVIEDQTEDRQEPNQQYVAMVPLQEGDCSAQFAGRSNIAPPQVMEQNIPENRDRHYPDHQTIRAERFDPVNRLEHQPVHEAGGEQDAQL